LALFVRGPGHPPLVQDAIRLDDAEPLVVTVADGARLFGKAAPGQALVDLRVLAGLPAEGSLEGSHRNLLPGVRLARQEPKGWRLFPRDRAVVFAADGTFELAGAPAGVWDVWVEWWEADEEGTHSSSLHTTVARVDLRDRRNRTRAGSVAVAHGRTRRPR